MEFIYILLPSVLFILITYLQIKWKNMSKGGSIELPGPTPLPIIGNLHQVGIGAMFRTFTKMSRSFGPIFKVHLGELTWIIVNDHNIAKDLLVTRGPSFSSRPKLGIFTAILCQGSKSVAFSPNTNWWKTMRMLEMQSLRPHLIEKNYFPVICDNAKSYLQRLSQGNNIAQNPAEEIRFLVTKILITIVFGDLGSDPAILERYSSLTKEIVEFMDFKGNLMSVFSWLKYFGVQTILEKEIRALTAKKFEFCNGLLQRIKQRMIENGPDSETNICAEVLKLTTVDPDPSFVASPYTHEFKKDENGKYIFDKYDVINICNDLVIAGTNTTIGALLWIYAILANHPRVQRKLQQELDRVVGKGKFYTLAHDANLHYLKAIIKESLRFRTAATLTIPHCCSQDETYNGYHIPANAGILVNVEGIHSDPRLFDEPHEFHPERYLDENGHLKKYDDLRDPWIFSRGRRACIGVNLAYSNLCAVIGYTLAIYNLELEKDLSTNEPIKIDLDAGKGHDFDFLPLDYKIIFKVREGIDIETVFAK